MSQDPITIVVSMEGGIVSDVSANGPARVIIREYDKNMNPREDPERYIAVDGDPYYFQDWQAEETEHQGEVAKIIEIVDQAPRCERCLGPLVNGKWKYQLAGGICHFCNCGE